MNKTQLSAQIRFALSQLAARNAHHEFEHLCRKLARARICGNILPATGPVSAGGDQSRDFETFRTYLDKSDLAYRSFVGSASEGAIAFACTTQSDGIPGKVRDDVTKIMGSGTPVAGVHYFLSEDLPVSKRHELQDWGRREHSVHLEIYDAQAISELLAEPDVFWIAVEHLSISAESYPTEELKDNPAWYQDLRTRWRTASANDAGTADFYDFKRALRAATYNDDLRPDLTNWLQRIGIFEDNSHPVKLQRKACYEISVAMLRGQGSMIGREQRLRDYFSTIHTLEIPADLEDAAVLVSFCIGAWLQNATQLNPTEILSYQRAVAERLDALLAHQDSPNLRCCYLQTRGYTGMWDNAERSWPPTPNLTAIFTFWNRVPDEAKQAPLFPLEKFSDLLTEFIQIAGIDPRLQSLTERTDSLVAERVGGIVAAETIRDRALAFYDKGHILRAIDELHRVKLSWFNDESLHGCCLTLLLISQWYMKLGLTFAGKYYALAAAHVAFNSGRENLKRFVPRGLVLAADCAFQQGCWFDFISLVEIGMSARSSVPSTRRGAGSDEDVQRVLHHCLMIELAAERFDVNAASAVRSRRVHWGVDHLFDEVLPEAKAIWSQCSDDEYWNRLQELDARPFSDAGKRRTVKWHQLGVTWSVEWENTYATSAKAEQLIALLQILLCVLSKADFCLLESEVNIEFCLADDITEPDPQMVPENKLRRWRIRWPSGILLEGNRGDNSPMDDALDVANRLLFDLSLLPHPTFLQHIEELFREGLGSKIHFIRSYESLFRWALTEESFDAPTRQSITPLAPARKYPVPQHAELTPSYGLGPGYSKTESEEMIARRYERCASLASFTLQRLNRDQQFRETVARLRDDGWRDWHILLALTNVVMNYRARAVCANDPAQFAAAHAFVAKTPETLSSLQVPMTEFSIDKMRACLEMSAWSTLQNFGLECHQLTPDIPATMKFLADRYNYWSDDIPHEAIFQFSIDRV